MSVIKAADLKVGMVVCFASGRFPFGDHQVVKEEDNGFKLIRPYVDCDGKVGQEEAWWSKDSPFAFILLELPL